MSDEEINDIDLDFYKKEFRFVFCRACGSEMRRSPLVICSDCLGDEVDVFYKAAKGGKSSK